jgi:hypothetical protein
MSRSWNAKKEKIRVYASHEPFMEREERKNKGLRVA